MSKEYSNESISTLKGADRVRLRPGVMLGADDINGTQQTVFEILSNSIDEARQGHGNIIKVIRHTDKSITVEDKGRGVPLDYNEGEKRYNWDLVFCELYAGGKYGNIGEQDDKKEMEYEFSLGLNGLGAAASQFSSEYMTVEAIRDKTKYEIEFEKGNVKGKLKKTPLKGKHETGTIIKWRPDLEVFTDIDIPLEFYKDTLKKQAVVNRGLVFELVDEESIETYEYLYEEGILDYVKEISEGKEFAGPQFYSMETSGRDRDDKPEYKVKAEIAFSFTNEDTLIEYYHNSSPLEHGGSPDRALKSAFVRVIDKFLKDGDYYNKTEKKITFSDVEDSLIYVSNSFSTITSYENQTKKAINNKFIQQAMTDFIGKKLEIYLLENRIEAEKVLKQILNNKRSREKAETTRIDVRKKLANDTSITNKVKKFVDCDTRDKELRELYIVEGDSAVGSTKQGRASEFQAIMPVRGKILNCLKADYNRIFNSEIIVDLLKVMGCGVEIKSKSNKGLNNFDIDKLDWRRIIICTDADVDGFQIRTLILTMLYVLTPTLIKEGKVFIAESPLYEISKGKDIKFAYDEKEKDKIIKKFKTGYKIQRSKGLGENEPEMMWETTMNPETRRLIKVTMEDIVRANEYFELFLGDNVSNRRDFISENGHKYIDITELD